MTRILSARVLRAQRGGETGRVHAVVRLLVETRPGGGMDQVDVTVAAPGQAPGAAPLRHRLLSAAKLALAAAPTAYLSRRAA